MLQMFLRSTNRKKDGKDHRYFSVVENRRVAGAKRRNELCCIWERLTTSSKPLGGKH